MDDKTQKRILRHLKINNIFMGILAVFLIGMMAIAGFLVWTVVAFINDARDSVERIETRTQETLDIRQQICDQGTLRQFIADDFCTETQAQ